MQNMIKSQRTLPKSTLGGRPVRHTHNLRSFAARSIQGFSLIEVLIALVVLAFGLLGLAFMQVLSVRYTQSAQHRTIATNLAYEMLDMMRANSKAAKQYGYVTEADFGAAPPAGGCPRTGDVSYLKNIERWNCEVRSSLPAGKGSVVFTGDEVTVSLAWSDDVGQEDGKGAGVAGKTTKFELSTRL